MKLRIKFNKFGAVKFIGHLDVMRFFQKALRRADIDVAYSGGFSPHQIMSFASPLGLGLESNGEYLDVEVNSLISSQEFMDRVNAVSIPEIQVLDVRLLPDNAGNAMASVAAAGYTIQFREDRALEGNMQECFERFMKQEQILITKATKRGSAQIDLKPAIYEFKVNDNNLYLLVNASSEGNIKPNLVMEAYAAFLGQELQANALLITREETYGSKVNKSGEQIFIPLADFGEWIN